MSLDVLFKLNYYLITYPSVLFNDRSKAVLLLWILFVIYVSCFSFLCCRVCLLQPCDHLLGKGLPLGSLVCDVFLYFCQYLYCVPDQVWYFFVSIPDLYLLDLFMRKTSKLSCLFITMNMITYEEVDRCLILLLSSPPLKKL